MAQRRYIIGKEDVPQPEDIGRLITIDLREKHFVHASHKGNARVRYKDRVQVGRLIGYEEDRGTFVMDSDDGDPHDHVGEERYHATLYLEGQRIVKVHDQDHAQITVHDVPESKGPAA